MGEGPQEGDKWPFVVFLGRMVTVRTHPAGMLGEMITEEDLEIHVGLRHVDVA